MGIPSLSVAPQKPSGAGGAGSPPVIYSNFPERLQQLLPPPPLLRARARPDLNLNIAQKRAKRKSKFLKAQDELIVSLKKKGKSWVEIAEISGVGSYLAARNRYQVIVGQQGNNNLSSWDLRDKVHLQQILDAGELEKWRFISSELNKATNKTFTDAECRDVIRYMFWNNPGSFGVNEDTINECLKEKKITEKSIEQRDQQYKKKSDGSIGSLDENLLRKRKSILLPELKKEAANASAATVTAVNNTNAAAYYSSGAPQTLPHPYHRGYGSNTPGANTNASNTAANQYASYSKHYY